MRDQFRILVVSGAPELAGEARQCVSETRPLAVVQWLKDPAVALARAGGGDVDALVVDPACLGDGSHLQDWLDCLHRSGPRTQPVVVSGSSDWTAELRRIAARGTFRSEPSGSNPMPGAARKAKWIGFLGAKGGVGTTTLALNVAYVLAQKHAAVLAEFGAGNDSLALRVRTTAKSIGPPGAALRALWSVKGSPGLRLALAEDILDPEAAAGEWEGAQPDPLLLDLGATLAAPVKSTLPRLDVLALIVDMEMLSIECARRVLSVILQPDTCPRGSIGVVMVNRASLACPIALDEVQRLMGLPILGCIPPAGDLCNAAQKARRTVVEFEPESLAAQSLVQAADAIAELT